MSKRGRFNMQLLCWPELGVAISYEMQIVLSKAKNMSKRSMLESANALPNSGWSWPLGDASANFAIEMASLTFSL